MAVQHTLSSVLKKKLWIVTGKGGVGKTTLAGSLGLMCAEQGLQTLLVETHGLNHLGNLLEVGTVGYEGRRIRKNLSLMQITPEAAFEEYVLQQIRFRMIYNAVFKNKYVRHFIDAAPGLIELLTIGKIWSLVAEKGKWPRKKYYDMVIVDAPSTGHGLSLLTVPQVVINAVRVGPLRTKSEQILSVLKDPDKTLVWLATLPEEMPVNEAVDMAGKLHSEVGMNRGPLIVNGLWPNLLGEQARRDLKKWEGASNLLAVYNKRLQLSRFYLDKIKDKLPERDLIEMPLIHDTTRPLHLAEQLKVKFLEKLSSR